MMKKRTIDHPIKLSALLLTLALLLALVVPFSSMASAESVRSKADVISYIRSHPVDREQVCGYSQPASAKRPYELGVLTEETYFNYLNSVNQVRYVAGLGEVTLDENLTILEQTVALVNAANDELSHYPAKPAGMDDELYKLAYEGAGYSNLAMGFDGPAQAVFDGWMYDSDDYNLPVLGHRRWILNPGFGETGFGQVGIYSAMFIMDWSADDEDRPVSWPAANMPTDMFADGEAWCYLPGRKLTESELGSIQVTLTNTKTRKVIRFTDPTDSTGSTSSLDGYFFVNNDYCGMPGAIIFAPTEWQIPTYVDGDVYEVKITGLDSGTVTYNVNFFDVPAEMNVTLASSKGTDLQAKTQTTLTATAEGGKAPYSYKFVVYNADTDQWYKIRDFASANTCDWYTGAAGSKILYVDVKDSTGMTKRQELPVKVSESAPAPLTVTSFTSSKGTKLDARTNTTLTAKASGGKAPYTYKFIVYNNQTGEWYRIRDFATSNTCDWYTGGDGSKTLYVDVKDDAGTVKRQELAVTVSSQLTAKLTSSKGTSLKAKDTTTLTAQATGGSGSGYTYKFIVYNTETGQWFKIQDYSTKKTASWYTGTAGKKILYLDIKDSAGNYVRTPLNVTVK